MSRGPGRIERAIRQLLDQHPDEAFTTDDLCVACYPWLAADVVVDRAYFDRTEAGGIEHKHRVAVLRTLDRMIKSANPPPHRYAMRGRAAGNMLVFYNPLSLPAARQALKCCRPWQAREPDAAETLVAENRIELHGTFEERTALVKQRNARLIAHMAQVGVRPPEHWLAPLPLMRHEQHLEPEQMLPEDISADLAALAAKARALITENDPDAIRDGLRQIAEALERLE
jgi:hypothetical protein